MHWVQQGWNISNFYVAVGSLQAQYKFNTQRIQLQLTCKGLAATYLERCLLLLLCIRSAHLEILRFPMHGAY